MDTILATSNLLLGLFILSLKDSTSVSAEIWGAIFLVIFAVLLFSNKLKNKKIIIGLAAKASLIGITLLIVYSKSLRNKEEFFNTCKLVPTIIYRLKLCNRVALDLLKAICGFLIITVNILVVANGSSSSHQSLKASVLRRTQSVQQITI